MNAIASRAPALTVAVNLLRKPTLIQAPTKYVSCGVEPLESQVLMAQVSLPLKNGRGGEPC